MEENPAEDIEDTKRDLILEKFRHLLNTFKVKLLDWLDQKDGDVEERQDTGRIQIVKDNLVELYQILHAAMEAGGVNQRPDMQAKSICSIFEKDGFLPAYRADKKLQRRMKDALYVDLITYPLTQRPEQIQTFEKKAIPSHQNEIIPNKEQASIT